ncbi:MAG: hypothetical protein QM737_02280 [Ferruginibacter sp.]
MRVTILVLVMSLFFLSCNKDKYTTAPQIEYKSISPTAFENLPDSPAPEITFTVTDAEGDIGITKDDTARIFIKNLFSQMVDSIDFPDISEATRKNLKAEVTVKIGPLTGCLDPTDPPHIDTMAFEVYVKDFAKNQSNTFTTQSVIEQCR